MILPSLWQRIKFYLTSALSPERLPASLVPDAIVIRSFEQRTDRREWRSCEGACVEVLKRSKSLWTVHKSRPSFKETVLTSSLSSSSHPSPHCLTIIMAELAVCHVARSQPFMKPFLRVDRPHNTKQILNLNSRTEVGDSETSSVNSSRNSSESFCVVEPV